MISYNLNLSRKFRTLKKKTSLKLRRLLKSRLVIPKQEAWMVKVSHSNSWDTIAFLVFLKWHLMTSLLGLDPQVNIWLSLFGSDTPSWAPFVFGILTNLSFLDSDRKSPPWTLHVRTTAGKTFTLFLDPDSCTVEDLKFKIQEKEGFPMTRQVLAVGFKPLADGKLLKEYNLANESSLALLIRDIWAE